MKTSASEPLKLWILPSGKFYEGDAAGQREKRLYCQLAQEFEDRIQFEIFETPEAIESEEKFVRALQKLIQKLEDYKKPQAVFAYSRGAELLWASFEKLNETVNIEAILVWGNLIENSVSLPQSVKSFEISTGDEDLIAFVDPDTALENQAIQTLEPSDYLSESVASLNFTDNQMVGFRVIKNAGHLLPDYLAAVEHFRTWLSFIQGAKAHEC